MLSALLLANDVKAIIPTVLLVVPSVPFYAAGVGWAFVGQFLPEPWYRRIDDEIYGLYQRLVLFFFENISGVKVGPRILKFRV